ncbi:MAG: endonuclease/exonuclease/phosphatase family protein [Clostridiales bacterium]|nr:endonuclease/exonuclease/phosphatase family protein [Clostridiales bacterium]
MNSVTIRNLAALFSMLIAFFGSIADAVKPNPSYAPEAEVIAEEGAIRIMSYNLKNAISNLVEFQDRKIILADQINEYHPDSFGVQEADPPWMTALSSLLPEYAHVGVGRDDGKNSGEYSAVFYLKDKYELLDSGTFWISETPEEPSFGWGAACRRVCTYAILKNTETGETYAHYNTHLDHVSEEARANGANLIMERIASCEYPAVLTGDFNLGEGCDIYNNIVAGPLADSKFAAPDTMSHGTYNGFSTNDISDNAPIDFIFFTESSMTALRYRVLPYNIFDNGPVSDHYPIYADLKINSQD